jgi:chromosome segregation ATPase
MSNMETIHQRLQDGESPRQLIAEGFPRSTVYLVNRRIKGMQGSPGKTDAVVTDEEIQELKQEKARLSLQVQISKLEAERERLPNRVTRLERQLSLLLDHLTEFEKAWEEWSHNAQFRINFVMRMLEASPEQEEAFAKEEKEAKAEMEKHIAEVRRNLKAIGELYQAD